MADVFLHNPRCSKSRAALELVRGAGVELPVREYLKEPLSVDELWRIVRLLGVRPIDIVRRGEPQYAALGLGDATPDDDVLRAMAEHPILIEFVNGPYTSAVSKNVTPRSTAARSRAMLS